MQRVVCERLCVFYKPEKEEMKCGTMEFLERNLTRTEILSFAGRARPLVEASAHDDEIRHMVCESVCEFWKTDDCDFRLGKPSAPCGGYSVVAALLDEK